MTAQIIDTPDATNLIPILSDLMSSLEDISLKEIDIKIEFTRRENNTCFMHLIIHGQNNSCYAPFYDFQKESEIKAMIEKLLLLIKAQDFPEIEKLCNSYIAVM